MLATLTSRAPRSLTQLSAQPCRELYAPRKAVGAVKHGSKQAARDHPLLEACGCLGASRPQPSGPLPGWSRRYATVRAAPQLATLSAREGSQMTLAWPLFLDPSGLEDGPWLTSQLGQTRPRDLGIMNGRGEDFSHVLVTRRRRRSRTIPVNSQRSAEPCICSARGWSSCATKPLRLRRLSGARMRGRTNSVVHEAIISS
jgi:hypothetical protein